MQLGVSKSLVSSSQKLAKQVETLLDSKKIFPFKDRNKGDLTSKDTAAPPVSQPNELASFLKKYSHLESIYGESCQEIYQLLKKDQSTGQFISTAPPLIKGEVIHAVEQEMAVKLTDVVFRRTDIGNARFPGRDTLVKIADIMAEQLVWSTEQKMAEVEDVVKIYKKNLAVM